VIYAAPSRFGAARARYQNVDLNSRIEAANPHGLVAILFDELLKAIDALSVAMKAKDWGQRATRQSRVLSILHGLESSLDIEQGGEIAASLLSIYRECRRLVLAAGREHDPEHLTRAREMLAEIASAWESIR
jgi:flagellar secretion chaperone FliS